MQNRIPLSLIGENNRSKTYQLVPGPSALMRIAREVGDPMRLVLRMAGADELGPPDFLDVYKVLEIALTESGGADLDDADIEAMLFRTGVGVLYEPYGEFLGALVNGGRTIEIDEGDVDGAADDAGAQPGGNRADRRAAAAAGKKPRAEPGAKTKRKAPARKK